MPQELRIAFRGFENGIDWRQAVSVPGRKVGNGAFSETAARGMMAGLGGTRAGPMVNSINELSNAPAGRVSTSGSIPGVTMPGVATDFTVALGPGGNVGAFIQGSAGGGLYWWIRPGPDEIGLWGSVGIGVTSNLGVSAGMQVSVWYGAAPAVLAGESLGVAVDVSVGPATVTGMAFFSVPPGGMFLTPGMKFPSAAPPGWKTKLIGLGFMLSAGFSVLPVDISVGPSMTWIKPLTP